MSLSFTRAPLVAVGEAVTSRTLRGLARAFNDRLRSGIGDGGWRVVFYMLGLWRQVRNPDGDLWPAQAEFFEFYQMLRPEAGATWPEAGPGLPAGANVSSPMMAYVFGNEGAGLWDEVVRLSDPEEGGVLLAEVDTPLDMTGLRRMQRGAWDPDTGAVASPTWRAARSYAGIRYSGLSPHGNAYGGYLATPDLAETPCLDPDPDDDVAPPPNYVRKFTPLKAGLAVKTYPGSCQPTAEEAYADHVAWIAYLPEAYVVHLNSGAIEVLATEDYLEGPYEGESRTRKTPGEQLARALNAFSRDWRGTAARAEDGEMPGNVTGGWNAKAAGFQELLTRQWLLAPARGVEMADGVADVYPAWRLTAGAAQRRERGTGFPQADGPSAAHVIHPRCVGAMLWITASKLRGATALEVLSDGAVWRTVALEPEAGAVAVTEVLDPPVPGGASVSFRLGGAAEWTSAGGELRVELEELMGYKAHHWDVALLLRLGGAQFNDGPGGMDGRGIDQEDARRITERYFATGGIVNVSGHLGLPGPLAGEVNTNAVFDAARRLSQHVRIVPPVQVLGYEVKDGRSILTCLRYARGMSRETPIDLFAGLLDIRHEAPASGWTNEWVMGVECKAYHPSVSSIWKPEAYSEYFPLSNRCGFYSPELANDPMLVWHTSYGQAVSGHFGGVLAPELPSGWNYARLGRAWSGQAYLNEIICDPADAACQAARANFCRSCQIYRAPGEIERIEAVTVNGAELVRLTFRGRLQHTHGQTGGAPASVAGDISTWSAGTIEAEPYRTDENAIRLFLLHQHTGRNSPAGIGDNAWHSTVQGLPDNPYASVWPHLLFTKLVPEPYEDENDTQQAADTPLWSDVYGLMELYLRALCEGFVDGQTSASYACVHGTRTLYDFTWEALCYQAFGGRWMHTLPTAPTRLTPEAQTRPDKPQGFGPMPNTAVTAEVVNQLARGVNLLTRARVMLPYVIETRTIYRSGQRPVSAPGACTTTGTMASYVDDAEPPPADQVTVGDWAEVALPTDLVAQRTGNMTGCPFALATSETSTEWRVVIQSDYLEAVPSAWRELLNTNVHIVASRHDTADKSVRREVALENSDGCCFAYQQPCPGFWQFPNGNYGAWVSARVLDEQSCGVDAPRVITAPPLPRSDYNIGRITSFAAGEFCGGGPATASTVTLMGSELALSVPLVDA